jgi:hypothetical protein
MKHAGIFSWCASVHWYSLVMMGSQSFYSSFCLMSKILLPYNVILIEPGNDNITIANNHVFFVISIVLIVLPSILTFMGKV